MKPVNFDYVRASSIDEAVQTLVSFEGTAKIIAGGQSLMPLLNMRLARPTALVDINGIANLNTIEIGDSAVTIGATVRQRQAERSVEIKQYLPLLSKAIPLVGHTQIRNRGTIVGSIVHADPSSEIPLVALILDAVLEIAGPSGVRSVPVAEFFYGYMMTDLQQDEIVTAVKWPGVMKDAALMRGTSFTEMARREGDFALVSAACQMDVDADGRIVDVRIGVGGAGSAPLRLTDAEDSLKGSIGSERIFKEAAESIADYLEPDEDQFVSAEYRRKVAVNLTCVALCEAWEEVVECKKMLDGEG